MIVIGGISAKGMIGLSVMLMVIVPVSVLFEVPREKVSVWTAFGSTPTNVERARAMTAVSVAVGSTFARRRPSPIAFRIEPLALNTSAKLRMPIISTIRMGRAIANSIA